MGSQKTFVFACEPPVREPGQNGGGTHAAVAEQATELKRRGYDVRILSMETLSHIPRRKTGYGYVKEVLDGLLLRGELAGVNIATDFRLGYLVRKWCLETGFPFTTMFHTRYPELLNINHRVPLRVGNTWARWFHSAAHTVMVPTVSMQRKLNELGLTNTECCPHGVDVNRFCPGDRTYFDHLGLRRPFCLFVGLVSEAKGVANLLRVTQDMEGTTIVVGDGPLRPALESQYADSAYFAGMRSGEDLVACYRAADVFASASEVETAGLVFNEALACGVPVAGLPVEGPLDVISNRLVGRLDRDLARAIEEARQLNRDDCRAHAVDNSWERSMDRFLQLIPEPVPATHRNGAPFGLTMKTGVGSRLIERGTMYVHYVLFEREPKPTA